MNAREFYEAVKRMRRLQRDYDKSRSSFCLSAAQRAEKEVDDEIARVEKKISKPKRQDLFDGQHI